MTSPAPSLEVRNVTVEYHTGRRRPSVYGALDVSLTLRNGEILGLVGESGSGKTTLMKAIAGLVRYYGDIRIDGTDPQSIEVDQARRKWVSQKVGVVFQNAGGSLVPHMPVFEQLMLPMQIHGVGTAAERRKRAGELLDLVKMPSAAAGRTPEEISGGQRQRVAIARSLALKPALIIADEPTSALDISVRAELITLLDELRQITEVAILVISHDLTTIEYLADVVAVMYRGSIVEIASANDIAEARLHPYSRDLWNASPRLQDAGIRALHAPSGALERSEAGCHYAPRCDRWTHECSRRLPLLRPVSAPRVRCLHPLGHFKIAGPADTSVKQDGW